MALGPREGCYFKKSDLEEVSSELGCTIDIFVVPRKILNSFHFQASVKLDEDGNQGKSIAMIIIYINISEE